MRRTDPEKCARHSPPYPLSAVARSDGARANRVELVWRMRRSGLARSTQLEQRPPTRRDLR